MTLMAAAALVLPTDHLCMLILDPGYCSRNFCLSENITAHQALDLLAVAKLRRFCFVLSPITLCGLPRISHRLVPSAFAAFLACLVTVVLWALVLVWPCSCSIRATCSALVIFPFLKIFNAILAASVDSAGFLPFERMGWTHPVVSKRCIQRRAASRLTPHARATLL